MDQQLVLVSLPITWIKKLLPITLFRHLNIASNRSEVIYCRHILVLNQCSGLMEPARSGGKVKYLNTLDQGYLLWDDHGLVRLSDSWYDVSDRSCGAFLDVSPH